MTPLYGQIFNRFMIRPEDPLNKTILVRRRGPAGLGVRHAEARHCSPPEPDRVALISFLSRDPRLSGCYQYGYLFQPEVWPR
jgi:hypothetical protein